MAATDIYTDQTALYVVGDMFRQLPYREWYLIPTDQETLCHPRSISKFASIKENELFVLLLASSFIRLRAGAFIVTRDNGMQCLESFYDKKGRRDVCIKSSPMRLSLSGGGEAQTVSFCLSSQECVGCQDPHHACLHVGN